MSFTDIKTKSQGFTIVELLIVVVVIAILAAITIVSYTGITNRANAAGAQETASNLQKKLETYAADGPTGTYPLTATLLATEGNSWSVPKTMFTVNGSNAITNSAPTSSNGSNTVQYQLCGRANTGTSPVAAPGNVAGITVPTGYKVAYWDFGSPAALNTTGVTGGQTSGTVTVNSVVYGIACFPPAS